MECAQKFSFQAIRNLALIEEDTTVIFEINLHRWFYTYQGRFSKWWSPIRGV